MANWAAQLPGRDYGAPKSTAIYNAVEVLLGKAHRDRDADLLVAAGAAWSLLGYAPQWIVDPVSIGGNRGHEFVERAFRRRSRKKLRTEGMGILRSLAALEDLGLLRQEWVSRAGAAAGGYGELALPTVIEAREMVKP